MRPAAAPHHLLRRTSSVWENVIRRRPSFTDIFARASLLDLDFGGISSAEAVASYFLHKQQDAMDARLHELQRRQRIGLPKMMSLLWLSSDCTWKASLLCGYLYKSILDAKLCIAWVQTILEAPSPYSQLGVLLLSLPDLQNLFSGHTLQECQDHFLEIDNKLKRYQNRISVRAFSWISTWAHHGASHYSLAVRAVKAQLPSRFSMCNAGMKVSDEYNDDGVTAKPSALHAESGKPAYSGFTGFTPLHKARMRLQKLETCMRAINIMFDTLKLLVTGTNRQTLHECHIESLRDEPLMFNCVAELITVCHANLSKHLDDLSEQVLISFCFINNARDLVYYM